jgi:flavoprotein
MHNSPGSKLVSYAVISTQKGSSQVYVVLADLHNMDNYSIKSVKIHLKHEVCNTHHAVCKYREITNKVFIICLLLGGGTGREKVEPEHKGSEAFPARHHSR